MGMEMANYGGEIHEEEEAVDVSDSELVSYFRSALASVSLHLSINKVGHAFHDMDPVFRKVGLWLALEDETTVNGFLWAIPGSHKNSLVRRFIRDDNGVHFDRPSPSYELKDFVLVEVKAGALVVIHGDLIHQSFENQSPNSRHAYSLHVVDTDGCEWADRLSSEVFQTLIFKLGMVSTYSPA